MKKALGLSFSFVGTVVGAGFATGREILLYFGDVSVFSVLLAGVFLGVFSFVILSLACRFGSVFRAFGFLEKPVRVFALLSNFCVLCATVAGSEGVVYSLFSLHGGGIVTILLAVVAVFFGLKYVRVVNLVLVPVIAILVFVVFCKGASVSLGGKFSVVAPFSYASMNLVTGGFLIGSDADAPTKKERILCAVLSGTVLSALLVCVYYLVKGSTAEMPFPDKASSLSLGVVGNVVLYLSMLTTAVGTLRVCSGKNAYAPLLVAAGALLVSAVGFSRIVDVVYPIVGAVGGAITVCALVLYLRAFIPGSLRFCTRSSRSGDFSGCLRRRRGN